MVADVPYKSRDGKPIWLMGHGLLIPGLEDV